MDRLPRQRTTIAANDPCIAALSEAWDPKRVRFIESPTGEAVPVRCYGYTGTGRPVIICHGLQSHSGWFVQSAQRLGQAGHPAYAMDRMGSGLSTATRGHCQDFNHWLDEIDLVLREAMRQHDHDDCVILGHGFGALLATAYCCRYPDRVAGLIASAPTIHARIDLPLPTRMAVWWRHLIDPQRYYPLPVDASSISENPDFIDFARNDSLALREATAGFYHAVVMARRFIFEQLHQLSMPALICFAGHDPLVDQQRTRRLVQQAPSENTRLVVYPDSRHIIEFGPERGRYCDDLIAWLAGLDGAS
jgi:alpha-beta hydrolase superfamily lysophospholipase